MKVILVDIYVSGHHLSYIKLFSTFFSKLGLEVYLFFPNSSNEIKDEILLFSKQNNCKLYFFNPPSASSKSGRLSGISLIIKRWNSITEVIKNNQIKVKNTDLVFFPYLDPFLGPYVPVWILNLVFPYKWSGLLMNPQNCRVKMSFSNLRKGLFNPNNLLTSSFCKSIFVFDEFAAQNLSQALKITVNSFPDIIDSSEPNFDYWVCDEILSRKNGRNVVLLCGSISKRKGLITLLNVMDKIDPNKFFIVIVGKLDKNTFSQEELNLINKIVSCNSESHLFVDERIPSESEFNALVKICDIVFASYIDFTASSNLITKAAIFNKPIIVSSGYLMEEIVNKYKLGVSIKQSDYLSAIDAIELISNQEYLKEYSSSISLANFIINHSELNAINKLRLLIN